ncbi:MAG: hypothetical protein ACYTJ0_17370, partial [Planctomycetota bacterium]|jgi:hypothetical protein
MNVYRALSFLALSITLTGCGVAPSDAEAGTSTRTAAADRPAVPPEQAAAATLAEMLQVAEAGDWGAYVDRFYGEAHKFRGPADRDALVQRFETRWGAPVTEALRRAVGATPTIMPDGRAAFVDGDETLFELHRHDGRWMFHL